MDNKICDKCHCKIRDVSFQRNIDDNTKYCNCLNEHYKGIYDMINNNGSVVAFNGKINNIIEEYKEQIKSLREAKKDGKDFSTLFISRDGLFMRLDGEEFLEEQTIMIKDLLEKQIKKEEKLIQAIKNAKNIIDYSGGGDKWERVVTQDERKEFYKICEEFNIE